MLTDKIYNALKWLVMIGIPALTVAYVEISEVVALPYADIVGRISPIVCTLIGTLIGISTYQYHKENPEK